MLNPKKPKSNPKSKILIFLASLSVASIIIALLLTPKTGTPPNAANPLKAAILPHHLIARQAIELVLNEVLAAKPELILLITPNHYETGSKPVIISRTHDNNNQKALTVTTSLEATGIAEVNEAAAKGEHAINDTVMVVKRLDSNASILSLMVNPHISHSDLEDLIKVVAENIRQTAIIPIYSIDFSHGLFEQEAIKRDQETLQLIESSNYEQLRRLDSTYLDAPAVLLTALKTADTLDLKHTVLWHSNAVAVTNNPTERTVSYFIFGFYESQQVK